MASKATEEGKASALRLLVKIRPRTPELGQHTVLERHSCEEWRKVGGY